MFRSKFLMAAFVAAIAALAGPATSQAGFVIDISDNHGNVFHTVVGGATYSNPTITLGDLSINFGSTTNSPGNNVNSTVSSSSIAFSSLSHGLASNTVVTISVVANGFANAPNPVLASLFTSIGGSFVQGSNTSALTGETSVNGSAIASSDVSLTNNPLTSISLTTALVQNNPSSYTVGQTMVVTLNADPIANNLEASVSINSILNGGGNFQITPAPAGLILAASGLPFLGLLRRRLRRTETAVAA
jgi:hypothetical protein